MLRWLLGKTTGAGRTAPVNFRRFPANPIIRPEMLPGKDGENINGPSLIPAPEWLPGRLGNYYLYFAHHTGRHIRLAVADRLEGPWRIHEPGTLRLEQAPACRGHIASPDVHVDEARRQVRMYFHAPPAQEKRQRSYVAISGDGLNFSPSPEILAPFYLRAIPWKGEWIGMTRGGVLFRSKDGLSEFESIAAPFGESDAYSSAEGSVRHVALQAAGDLLTVYFSRLNSQPESILRCRIDLSKAPSKWRARDEELIARPETPEEGADLPFGISGKGAARGRENALRDPAIYIEGGREYLLYSVAGESGIAIGEIMPVDADQNHK